jgi:hypothetical protein
MLYQGGSPTVLKKRSCGLIVNALDWAISGGCAKFCNDITYSANDTLTQLFITANDIVIETGVTLTCTQLRPVIFICNSFTMEGTAVLTASGKGCNAGAAGSASGNRYCGGDWPVDAISTEEVSSTRNYCLCGSGGGGSTGPGVGGGAYNTGGAANTVGNDCDLTDAEIQELLFSPFFDYLQIGFGGGGAGSINAAGGDGAGTILIIASEITVPSGASILANGTDGSDHGVDGGGGGGGGFIGLIADDITVHESATVTATGGAGGEVDGSAGGAGVTPEIEV